MSPLAARLTDWSRIIKRDLHAIYLAARDPRVPWYAKALAAGVAAYALSPVDLIPDFIPVVGYLDDVILVPLGIWLAVRLIPPPIMTEHRAAAAIALEQPRSIAGLVAVVAIWLIAAGVAGWFAYRWLA